ncbi:MAG: hypothetical protein ACOYEC_02345 [Christensenellales bacterium]|jgi:predicted small secreted protein|nr:hypothetical protein [Clostridiales bacterium]
MKKRLLVILSALLAILCALLVLTACNTLKKGKDYNLYTFEPLMGKFVRNSSKIIFDKKQKYFIYDNSNILTNTGEYRDNNNYLTLIPDNVGDQNRMEAVESFYRYNSYIVHIPTSNQRKGETQFEDLSSLEGIYTSNIKIKNDKIYKSCDGSNLPESFTEEIGTYAVKGDFVIFYTESNQIRVYLQFTYVNSLGYTVRCLTDTFYSYKAPNFSSIDNAFVEMEKTIFYLEGDEEEEASYSLNLIAYPSKQRISEGVEYVITDIDSEAAVAGSVLTFKGTGRVNIKYRYGSFIDSASIYIVKFDLRDNLTEQQRTYQIGDRVSYQNMVSSKCQFNSSPAYDTSIKINNSSLAEAKNGYITFNESGTVNVTLVIRYKKARPSGKTETLTLEKNIDLIITE